MGLTISVELTRSSNQGAPC